MEFPVKLGSIGIVASALLLLTGCNGASEAPSVISSPSPTNSSPAPSPAPVAEASPADSSPQPVAEEPIISATGIGAAQLGMTLAELKQVLGSDVEYVVESPFIVDFDAISVRREGEVQYYILYLAGQSFTDTDVIQGLLTSNPKFRTAANVGPGTTIAEAAERYGSATLSYNTQNESREYVRFANQPAANLSFSTGSGGDSLAGIYASPTAEYNETQQFHADAVIQSVLVVCLTEDCAPQMEG
ncbi:MAG: hypothetical protein IGS50_05065 [Synechococcales cyanobacterium C42_A2020_086]|nr:hypothetical protein [Synechococcales cyanobacterium C42_A2020_086]